MKKQRVTCLFMVVFLVFSTTVAFADAIDDKKKELNSVNEDIEKAKSKIGKVKAEQGGLINQIAEIEVDLKAKEEQLAEIEQSLVALQESIEITEEELKEAIKRADLHKKLMDERICAMYMSAETSHMEIIEVMLDAKNITDFLDRVAMIREIMSIDREVFDEMQAIKDEIEDQKESLEEQREIEEGTKEDVVSQKALIEEKRQEKETLFEQLKEQQKGMEEDLGKLEKTSKNLKNTIQKLVAEREEQARRAREQAAQSSRGSRDSATAPKNNPPSKSISGNSNQIVNFALKFQGRPYVYGANGPNAFDCSGFTCYVYKNFGISLPRSARAQGNANIGTKITNRGDLRPGDLVYFTNSRGGGSRPIHHAGIYIGGGSFVHASSGKRSRKVVTSTLNSGYYRDGFCWGRRVIR